MELDCSSPQVNLNEVDAGKTCHQCRQKTRDLAASCKNLRNGKQCLIRVCRRCLLNRYGEKAEEVKMSDNWVCPKCRGICNCSCCMKKRGQQPTGALSHSAKASGFKSVSEMLSVKASGSLELNKGKKCVDNLSSGKVRTGEAASPISAIASEKDLVLGLSEVDKKQDAVYGVEHGAEAWAANEFLDPKTYVPNGFPINCAPYGGKEEMHQKKWNGPVAVSDGDNVGVVSQTVIAESLTVGKYAVNLVAEKIEEEIPLPPGTAITEIFDIKFPTEDVGNALQFLEFCRVFGKALDVKKGEAEAILRELAHNQNLGSGQNTSVVQFQIRLLTSIQNDSRIKSPSLTSTNENDSQWLKAVEDLITESDLVLKEFPTEWLKGGASGYDALDCSKKLSLLNFICDKALGTKVLRDYIDDQNKRFDEEKKEAKSKVAAAKEKVRTLKQKLRDEMAKAVMKKSNEDSLSNSEHDALLSMIKSEAVKAHTEMLEAKGTVPKRKQSSDAMRTGPEFLDSSGQTFWKLKSYNGEYAILLQGIKIQDADAAAADERWFVYGPEQKDEIDKYISSRAKRSKTRKARITSETSEANK